MINFKQQFILQNVLTQRQIINGCDWILGAFYTGAVFSLVMTNYSESCNKDLTVDLTLKHLETARRMSKGLCQKIKHHVNLSQNACFKLFNVWSSRYNKQVKNP